MQLSRVLPVNPLVPLLLSLLMVGCAGLPGFIQGSEEMTEERCPAPGEWVVAGQHESITSAQLLAQINENSIVLLGERHKSREDHQWQLHLLAALNGRFDNMAVGYEMFVRDQQPQLDAWLAGELNDEELLEQSDWDRHWGMDFSLYAPLLRFNRLQRVPGEALNVPRELVRRIGQEGWQAVPREERYGLSQAAEPREEYREFLATMASHHGHEAASEEEVTAFIRSQGVWDRAMAEGLYSLQQRGYGPVAGIIGRGHMENRQGVPRQLADLGAESVWVLLPWREGEACMGPDTTPADALYGLPL
ncbi:MAG: PDZ/DHR/GLGF protein [Halomonadaceae bacterium]|nr:MAG: PDZ/DHR/GLGF protein [Halomonadaceae bacterium]